MASLCLQRNSDSIKEGLRHKRVASSQIKGLHISKRTHHITRDVINLSDTGLVWPVKPNHCHSVLHCSGDAENPLNEKRVAVREILWHLLTVLAHHRPQKSSP